MGIESLSDISKGGTSAFAGGSLPANNLIGTASWVINWGGSGTIAAGNMRAIGDTNLPAAITMTFADTAIGGANARGLLNVLKAGDVIVCQPVNNGDWLTRFVITSAPSNVSLNRTTFQVANIGSSGFGTGPASLETVHFTFQYAPALGSAAPLMDGVAAAGTSTYAAREDHKHPSSITSASVSTTTDLISPWQNVLSITPASNSQGIFLGGMGQAVVSGTSSLIGGGHTAGLLGLSANYGSGTHAMMIGAEGRLDQANIGQGAPTLTKGVAALGLINISYGTVVDGQGLGSEVYVGAGATITTAYGAKVSVTANAGTITKYVGLGMPEHTGSIAGIAAKRFFENLDTQAPSVTKSPIVQQDYVVVWPTTGQTVTIGNFTTYTFIAPGTALAALTIALPSDPIDGQEVVVLVIQDVAALTLTAGVAILNPLITISGGATFAYKYVQGSSVWALIQSPALLGSATPLAAGVASVGTALRMAREDHRHPIDANTPVTDANLATSTGKYNLITPFTNSPNGAAGAINVTEENGRITQKGYFWFSALNVLQEHTRYFNGTVWSDWYVDVKAGTASEFINVVNTQLSASVATTYDINPFVAKHFTLTMTANTTLAVNAFLVNDNRTVITTVQLFGAFTPSFTGMTWVGGAPVYYPGIVYEFTTYKVSGVATHLATVKSNSAPSGTMPMLRIPTTQRHIAGCVNGTALSTLALTAARIYYIPFVPARRMVLTALGISVSTLTAGTGTAGIYAADGNANFDYPGSLLASTSQGALNTGATGTKTGSIDITLEAGVTYFIGLINTSAATVRAVALAAQDAMLGWTDNSSTNINCYYRAGATNVLPSTAGAPTALISSAIPAVYLI